MPRVLITGGGGLLGSMLIQCAPDGHEVHATRRHTPVTGCASHEVELSDPAATLALLARLRPDVVVHTAYSATEGERDIVAATRSVVDAAAEVGARLVHLSSDTVLDGERAPYAEDAQPAPVHQYGRWKAQAEAYVRERLPAAAIVRTSLIVSVGPLDRGSAWVANGLRAGTPPTLFVDELRCPIAAEDLADQIWEIVELPPAETAGVWNLAGPEAVSRYALGLLIAMHAGVDPVDLGAARSRESPTARPRDLRLLTTRADRALRTRPRPVSALLAG